MKYKYLDLPSIGGKIMIRFFSVILLLCGAVSSKPSPTSIGALSARIDSLKASVQTIESEGLFTNKRSDELERNKYGESDLEVQTRMADATQRGVVWSEVAAIFAILVGAGSILLSVRQWLLNRRWEVGSIEIDFRNHFFSAIEKEKNGMHLWVKYSLLYSGKSMVRLISTKFHVGRIDFMNLHQGWWKRIDADETYSHKMILEGQEEEFILWSKHVCDQKEVDVFYNTIPPSTVEVTPYCLIGFVKYANGIGETWIRPFIFRFARYNDGPPTVLPWGKHCQPVRVYPTLKTRIYEFGERHPKLFPLMLRLSRFSRD